MLKIEYIITVIEVKNCHLSVRIGGFLYSESLLWWQLLQCTLIVARLSS